MDKTLLRPLFQKRYMEMNKPPGFRSGAAIEFQQLAMANQSKQPSNDQGIMTITKPSGMQESVTFEEDPQREISEQVVDVLDPKTNTTLQAIEEGRQKAKKEMLFSEGEKRGIFAAQLAMALARPGDPLANLGAGLGGGAMALANLKGQEAELISKQKKFETSKAAIDTTTGEEAFVTEAQIQTTRKADGSPRFKPIPKSDQKKGKSITVYDTALKKPVTMLDTNLLAYLNENPNDQRYVQGLNTPVSVKLLTDVPGVGKKDDETTVTQAETLINPSFYQKKQGEFLDAMTKFTKKPQLADEIKNYNAAYLQLQKGAHLDEMIQMIESDIKDRGAIAGGLGAVSQYISSGKAYANFLGLKIDREKKINESNYYKNMNDLELVMRNPDAYLNKYNISKNSRQGQSLRTLASSFKSEFAKADAALDSSLINLAYAVAKAREEGGRFSVSDIELALRSIGGSSSTDVLLSRLARTGYNILSPAVKDFNDSLMMMSPENKPEVRRAMFEKNERLSRLPERVKYYQFYDNQERKAAEQRKKKIQEGGGNPGDDDKINDPYKKD